MLSVADKSACLAKGVFARLDPAALRALAERMGEREFAAGQPVFLEGEPGNEIFVVAAGAVEILRGGRVIAALGTGELIGEMAVLGKGVRTASGRARGATRLLFLRDKALQLLIQQIPEIAFAIFNALVERLDSTTELAFFLANPPAERGEVRVTAGDLAGQAFPIHHEASILGRSLGSLMEDAMRLALPSKDPALLARHARVTAAEATVFIEPFEGAVAVNGAPIETALQLGPEDEVQIGSLRLRFRST